MTRRRRGARNTYGSITEDKRRRSQSRGSVREASAQPPSYRSYAEIPQTPADEDWAAARAKSPSAVGKHASDAGPHGPDEAAAESQPASAASAAEAAMTTPTTGTMTRT